MRAIAFSEREPGRFALPFVMLRRTSERNTLRTRGQRQRLLTVGIGLLATAGVCVVIWEGFPKWSGLPRQGLKDAVVAKNLGQVEPRFWRSGQMSPATVAPTLSRLDLDLIVSLSPDNPENSQNMAEFRAATRLGIERVHVDLKGDGTGDPMEYVDALRHIIIAREHNERVLVHCWAGSERTSGLVALYRTLYRGEDAAKASAEMGDFGHEYDEGVLIDYLNDNVAFIANELAHPTDGREPVLKEVPETLPVFTVP